MYLRLYVFKSNEGSTNKGSLYLRLLKIIITKEYNTQGHAGLVWCGLVCWLFLYNSVAQSVLFFVYHCDMPVITILNVLMEDMICLLFNHMGHLWDVLFLAITHVCNSSYKVIPSLASLIFWTIPSLEM